MSSVPAVKCNNLFCEYHKPDTFGKVSGRETFDRHPAHHLRIVDYSNVFGGVGVPGVKNQ